MNRLYIRMRATVAPLFLGLAMSSGGAMAQVVPRDQIVGTWIYVAVDMVRPDGTRVPLYGPDPQGQASFDGNGRYILMTARAGQPRFVSTDRMQGTAEENKAVVQGTIAHFGRYGVDDASGTITFHIETSTFPNWNGTDQKRPFTIKGDELSWRTPSSTGDGTAEVVLRRAR